MSAGRLGIAAGFLPADLRAEATAALLACRVLGAYEDLSDRPRGRGAVVTAVDYLNGDTDTPPSPPQAIAVRDSEAVDLVLVERIRDVRALLLALPFEGRKRVGRMLVDVGRVMAHNLDSPLRRTAYGDGVLGRVMLYACSLVAEDACAEADLSELAGCIGVTAQLANDLRGGELALYGARDREELIRTVMLRLLAPALGSFALLARLGPATPSRGARAAMAYMTITTTAFLCTAVGAPAPYRRGLRLAAAVLAAGSRVRWATMLARVRRSADGAIHQLLVASSKPVAEASLATGPGPAVEVLGLGDLRSMSPSMGPLLVGATFALVDALPEEPLTGELPATQVRRMMIADHLAFGAVERPLPRDADAMRTLAMQFQLSALDTAGTGPTHSVAERGTYSGGRRWDIAEGTPMRPWMGDIRTAPVPPGPSVVNVLRYWAQMVRDPLTTSGALRRKYGDTVRMPLSRSRNFFLSDRPEYVEHVLVRHQDRYVRSFT